jgi:hypothetical protein
VSAGRRPRYGRALTEVLEAPIVRGNGHDTALPDPFHHVPGCLDAGTPLREPTLLTRGHPNLIFFHDRLEP